ncbi:receptor-transporting protein 4-like [Montipora foliosa]|uniref:receptor-transporting protein 4-like n=1 Tax=Montipora foliosa TaxID=591990 RepID=UPI0035F15B79
MAPQSDDDVPSHPLKAHWHDTFERVFQIFLPDEWRLEPTNDGMSREWKQFRDSAKVKFICKGCRNSWTSMRGVVMFWFKKIDRTDRRDGLIQREEEDDETRPTEEASTRNKNLYSLRFKLYGQQCKRCSNKNFQQPQWYEEEVDKVLNNVHRKIGEVFYDFKKEERNNSKRHGRPRWSHDSERCQACQEGQCSNV